jgi:hypothetical protein
MTCTRANPRAETARGWRPRGAVRGARSVAAQRVRAVRAVRRARRTRSARAVHVLDERADAARGDMRNEGANGPKARRPPWRARPPHAQRTDGCPSGAACSSALLDGAARKEDDADGDDPSGEEAPCSPPLGGLAGGASTGLEDRHPIAGGAIGSGAL